MAFKDLFKRKKETLKKEEETREAKERPVQEMAAETVKRTTEAKERPQETVKAEAPKPLPKASIRPKTAKKPSAEAYRVLTSIHLTEKATDLSTKNQYVFKVFKNTNKIQIKKAVESVYGVNVISVNTINIPRKKKRWGRTEGFKKGYKKAIVKLKPGEKIDTMPG